jgi:hypothetical protein
MRLKVHLSIGYPTAVHDDIIEVDDTEYAECKTDEEREKLLDEHWREWAWNYIEGGFEVVE